MNILEAKEVTKRYGDFLALDQVSLSVPKQSIFGLLGPNGAGKSTLIRIVNQILDADSGEVLLKGQPMKRDDISNIGYMPEERGLYRKMKVGEQLIYLAQLKGLPGSKAREEARQWMQRLDIMDWYDKKVEQLSKGMQQKIQFITTVIHNPELLILDEPFSGFDPVNAEAIKQELIRLRNQGTTIILSTHRMEQVEEMCEFMVLINKAKKVIGGRVDEIRQNFKANIYRVIYRGELDEQGIPAGFVLQNQKLREDGFSTVTFRSEGMQHPNVLLQKLMASVEIHGFEEELPSINDIFIRLVKEKTA
ncbi:MAG: ATP-binding cassette domain-containing protein [Bacteroidia bacterium]